MSDPQRPHGLQPSRLLRPWDFPGKSIGVGCRKFYVMEDTESCGGSSPDPFCISFCIQKVSGDLHYLLAKKPVNTLWLSSLMDVNLIPPEVFSFNLHLLKALNEAASL